MLNDLFRTYKKIIILVLILLCGTIFWFYGCHRQQNNSKITQTWEKTELSDSGGYGYHFRTSEFSGNVVFGTQGYLAKDKTMPIVMKITSEESSFNGTLKITLPGEDGKGVSYQSAVNCQEGISSEIRMEVPKLGNVSYFYFEILDSFGTVKFSEEVKTHEEENKENSYATEIYLGVLSSQYSMLQYLDGMNLEVEDETVQIRLIRFLAADFPTRVEELGALSGILIDSFDTSVLTQMQVECLSSWVKQGGSLYIGTGTGAEVTLSGISKMVGAQTGKVSEMHYDFTGELSGAGSVKMYHAVLDFANQQEWEAFSFSSPESVYVKAYEQGFISMLSFSLTDDTFFQWTGRDKVIRLLFREKINKDAKVLRIDDTSLWYIKKALYSFMNARHPNTFYYGLFFIIYLGVLGFFSYYLLRKIKKREYIWGVVPVIAIVFTISLAFRTEGSNSDSGKSFASVRISDSSLQQEDYYFLYQNNEGEENSVDLVPSVESVEPVDYNYLDTMVDNAAAQSVTQNYTVNNTRNGFDIVFEETIPGSSYLLKCSSKSNPSEVTNCFTADIRADYSYFEGKVTNTSDWNFDKVVFIRGRQYIVMDGMSPGETVTIDGDDVAFWSGYEEENHMFANVDDTSTVGNLVEYIQQRYITENEDQNTFIAIGITDENDFRLVLDGDKTKNQLTMFVNRFSLQAPDEGDCIINMNTSCLDEESKSSSLQYDILEKNETKVVYSFDTSKLIWGMFRNRDGFKGTIYAYNYDTKEEDILFSEENEYMNCGALEPYISDMNKMILTFCLPDGIDYGEAPVLSVLTKDLE